MAGKLKIFILCLIFLAVDGAQAYTLKNNSMPVMQTTVTQTGNGANVIYSRPVMYAGSRMVKRPPYYKECKKKLGFWDADICAQYYVPKMLEKLDEEE